MKQQTSVAADWGKHGRRAAAVSNRKEPVYRTDRRRFWQFVACGGFFILLVAAKLLLPGRLESLSQRVSQLLDQNMDVQAVFSTVGDVFTRTISPDEALEEVYRAVFAPGMNDGRETGVPERMPEEGTALDLLREYQPKTSEDTGTTEVSELAYLLYSDQNLPENVTLAQEILGFNYCTPVVGCVSSGFGYREHPTEGAERFHYGVDLAAEQGTAIACFADGVVTAVGESSSYGKYCVVSHDNGYETLYAHCSNVTATSGKQVLRGEKIAEVGQTGMATGPHLHFELQRNGMYLNPVYYVAA